MSDAPTHIRAHREEGVLELEWPDGTVDRLPFRFVRGRCPCAGCVDEMTGRRIVGVQDVPEDVQPTGMRMTGHYAVKITWNDGHDTGLYTWERLAEIGRERRA